MAISFVPTSSKSRTNIWNTDAQTIIINGNAEGKMHGICAALDNYDRGASLEYQVLCHKGKVHVGTPVRIISKKHADKQYVFFPIKAKSGDAPKWQALESCFKLLCQNGPLWDITSMATHKLGCGSSDVYLSWEHTVLPMLRYYLSGTIAPPLTVYGASEPIAPVQVEGHTQVVPAIVVPKEVITSYHVEPYIVFHASNPLWLVDFSIGEEENTTERPHYVPAGEVRIKVSSEDTPEQVLQHLFDLTQDGWHDLPCVTPGRSSRSTMPGDVVRDCRNSYYRVKGKGFEQIEPSHEFFVL